MGLPKIIMIIRTPWPPTAHFHHHPDPSYKGLPKHPFHYLASYYKRTHFHHHRNKRYKRSGPKLLKIVGYEGKLHQAARLGETHLSQNGSLANCAIHACTHLSWSVVTIFILQLPVYKPNGPLDGKSRTSSYNLVPTLALSPCCLAWRAL